MRLRQLRDRHRRGKNRGSAKYPQQPSSSKRKGTMWFVAVFVIAILGIGAIANADRVEELLRSYISTSEPPPTGMAAVPQSTAVPTLTVQEAVAATDETIMATRTPSVTPTPFPTAASASMPVAVTSVPLPSTATLTSVPPTPVLLPSHAATPTPAPVASPTSVRTATPTLVPTSTPTPAPPTATLTPNPPPHLRYLKEKELYARTHQCRTVEDRCRSGHTGRQHSCATACRGIS